MRVKDFIIALMFFPVFSVMAEDLAIPEDKMVIQFPSKLGVVTFPHQMHAALSITECKTCHHKMEPGDTVIKPCHECLCQPLVTGEPYDMVYTGFPGNFRSLVSTAIINYKYFDLFNSFYFTWDIPYSLRQCFFFIITWQLD